jgi:hypothetical protein
MKKIVLLLLLVASTAYGEIYTWKDARGTVFYTNSLHEIPARYRPRAKLLDVATGKKLPISAAQTAGPADSTASPGQPTPQGAQANPAPIGPANPTTNNPTAGNATANTPAAQAGVSSPPLQTRAQRRAQARQNRSTNQEE